MTDRDFVTEFQLRPSAAIETLLLFTDLGLVSKRDATQWVFPCLYRHAGKPGGSSTKRFSPWGNLRLFSI